MGLFQRTDHESLKSVRLLHHLGHHRHLHHLLAPRVNEHRQEEPDVVEHRLLHPLQFDAVRVEAEGGRASLIRARLGVSDLMGLERKGGERDGGYGREVDTARRVDVKGSTARVRTRTSSLRGRHAHLEHVTRRSHVHDVSDLPVRVGDALAACEVHL